jgi:chromatin remodeling complex protein RSC6
MNTNTSVTNTNNMSTTAPKAKRSVAKKSDVTVEVKVEAPAVAVKAAKAPKAKAAVEAPAPVAPAQTAAPEASAPKVAAPVTTVDEEVKRLTEQIDNMGNALKTARLALKAIEKRHAAELKEAKKRKRVKKVEGENKEPRPSVFTTPVLLKDSLATFLGKPVGTLMSPADVTKAVKVYIDAHKLKGDKHEIKPDTKMCSVLGIGAGETLTYKNIQRYLYQLYVKKEKVVVA